MREFLAALGDYPRTSVLLAIFIIWIVEEFTKGRK